MNILPYDGLFFETKNPSDSRFTLPQWSLPSWNRIKSKYPRVANQMIKEYNRVGGLIPFERGFVYLMHASGSNYYKIGKSSKPSRRILEIAPKMPFETEFVKVWRTYFMSVAETSLHRRFASQRANGEWFELEEEDLDILLSQNTANEIQYAYSFQWQEAIRRKDGDARAEWIELCNDAADADEFLNRFTFFSLADVHDLGENGHLFLSYLEYYFGEIDRDNAGQGW